MQTESNAADASHLISRSAEPLNLEMPFAALGDWITPNEQFYVRCHFPLPEIDAATWRLQIEGSVARPSSISLDELRQLPARTITATMECAGNGRSFLEPKVKGVQWDCGAVGNARWTGVSLRDVLERAGVDTRATEVILEGADRGAINELPKPPGEIHYARSLPVAKAMDDVLLAFAMNDAPLTAEHGFPLRAVAPGWFGMASVKWLRRIIVSGTAFNGYYQSIDYTFWEQRNGLPILRPLAEMQVKAQIARPAMGETVVAGSEYRVHGAAWAADAGITMVEISTDGGGTWQRGELTGEPVKNAWRFWHYAWRTPTEPGDYTLIARATDSDGRTQPARRIAEYGTYMVNHWLPVRVHVR